MSDVLLRRMEKKAYIESLKYRVPLTLTREQLLLLKVSGKYQNNWSSDKFVVAEKRGWLFRVFYDPRGETA